MKTPAKNRENPTTSRTKETSAPLASTGKTPSAKVSRSTGASITEGQRLLVGRPESGVAIGRTIGASKASVSAWRLGDKVPDVEARRALEASYAIPAASWSETPDHGRPSPAAPPRDVDGPGDAEPSGVEELLTTIRELRRDVRLLPGERVRACAEERALLSQISRNAKQASDSQAITLERILEHPEMKRFDSILHAALAPYPDAVRAVIKALESAQRST